MIEAQVDIKHEFASIHGRFQPFHNGHLTYVRLAKSRCRHLIVGITNPDQRHLTAHPSDPARHLRINNPFSFYERLRMIRASLHEAGISDEFFTVVPFPIDTPDLIESYCPKVPVLLRNRGDWTAAKMATLTEHGWPVEILTDETDLTITASDVRARILDQRPWHHLVPPASAAILIEINAHETIAALGRLIPVARPPVFSGADGPIRMDEAHTRVGDPIS